MQATNGERHVAVSTLPIEGSAHST